MKKIRGLKQLSRARKLEGGRSLPRRTVDYLIGRGREVLELEAAFSSRYHTARSFVSKEFDETTIKFLAGKAGRKEPLTADDLLDLQRIAKAVRGGRLEKKIKLEAIDDYVQNVYGSYRSGASRRVFDKLAKLSPDVVAEFLSTGYGSRRYGRSLPGYDPWEEYKRTHGGRDWVEEALDQFLADNGEAVEPDDRGE